MTITHALEVLDLIIKRSHKKSDNDYKQLHHLIRSRRIYNLTSKQIIDATKLKPAFIRALVTIANASEQDSGNLEITISKGGALITPIRLVRTAKYQEVEPFLGNTVSQGNSQGNTVTLTTIKGGQDA